MDNQMTQQEFQELLPFYLNGTLTTAEREQVDGFLAAHPDQIAALDFSRSVAAAAKSRLTDHAPLSGYPELKQRLDAHRTRQSVAATPGIWALLTALLSGWGLSPALGVVLLVMTMQLSLTGYQLAGSSDAQNGYRGTVAPARNADIKIVLKPTTSFEAMVTLLVQNGCQIVWGPSPVGELWLSVNEPGAALAVRQRLSESPLVEDAMVLPRKSP